MKNILVVLAAVLLLTIMACSGGDDAAAGNSSPSPSITLNGYSSALAAGDTNKALEYASQYSKDRQKGILEAAAADPYYREQLANAIKNAAKESETGQIIFYKMTMVTKDGQTIEDTFRLILEDGSWKLAGL